MRLDTLCFTFRFCKKYCSSSSISKSWSYYGNKKTVSIPSFQCRLNDIISVKEKSTSKNLVENNIKNNQVNDIPAHLKFDSFKIRSNSFRLL
jgi:small subunit ribosomal protein S4